MFLYNTTFAIDIDIEKEVISWLKETFLDKANISDYFLNVPAPNILRVLGAEPGVASVAVHLYAESIEDIEKWYADYGSELFNYVLKKWNKKVLFFSTTLELIHAC